MSLTCTKWCSVGEQKSATKRKYCRKQNTTSIKEKLMKQKLNKILCFPKEKSWKIIQNSHIKIRVPFFVPQRKVPNTQWAQALTAALKIRLIVAERHHARQWRQQPAVANALWPQRTPLTLRLLNYRTTGRKEVEKQENKWCAAVCVFCVSVNECGGELKCKRCENSTVWDKVCANGFFFC